MREDNYFLQKEITKLKIRTEGNVIKIVVPSVVTYIFQFFLYILDQCIADLNNLTKSCFLFSRSPTYL